MKTLFSLSMIVLAFTSRSAFCCYDEAIRRENIRALEICIKKSPFFLNSPDREGWTPLHKAIFSGSKEMVETLIHGGADVNLVAWYGLLEKTTRGSPLIVAVREDKVEIAEVLLSYGADVNETYIDDNTPLHYATSNYAFKNRNDRMIRLLYSYGGDPQLKSTFGKRPVDLLSAYLDGPESPVGSLLRQEKLRKNFVEKPLDETGTLDSDESLFGCNLF